jgi:hypothetical protein
MKRRRRGIRPGSGGQPAVADLDVGGGYDRLGCETYDSNGNVLSSGGKTFVYDFENRLKSVNGGKTVCSAVTRYLIDDLNPTRLPQVVEEVVNGTVYRTYTHGLQRISENQLTGPSVWTPSFYEYDGAGTVRAVTDTYDYDAYGSVVNIRVRRRTIRTWGCIICGRGI